VEEAIVKWTAMNKQALIAAALSLVSIAGHAQAPTFRTETTVVQLPVRALDGFHVLSDQTGGFAVTDTNNYRDPFDLIVRESSTYYLPAYTSTK
jgi:hypothetical protein